MALALSAARASVVINETNFPDPTFRQRIAEAEWDQDGNGTLSDEELAAVVYWELHDVENFKGLEHFTSLATLCIGRWDMEKGEYIHATNLDLSPFQQLWRFVFGGYDNTSVDVSVCKNVTDVEIANCPNLTSFKAPAGVEEFTLTDLPSLTSFDFSIYKNLKRCFFRDLGLTDLDFSNHPAIERINFSGSEEKLYTLNSINVADCPELVELGFWYVKTESFRLKNLPKFYAFVAENCDCSLITVEEMPVLGSVNCTNSDIRELNIRKCPELTGVGCADNKLRTLIIDDSPMLYGLGCANNQLMWLDMSNVKNLADSDLNTFKADSQHPAVVAVKISPTETGLRVHSRLDVNRVLNLRAKGITQTPRETTVDGIRYFVFYDNGPDTPNLVGSDCYYEYETKWPYPCIGENTKDNNLPVTLNVYSWTKHQAFLTLSESRVEGKYGEPAPAAPTVTRSQDYDGKITFSSSDESVVKVDPDTGVLTVVGAGTAIISVKGAETDYRLAPAVKTYTVYIEKATPVIAFPATEINAVYGETVPLNQLTVTWYEGTVTYASANEKKATVTAEGVVTTKGAGDVIIKGIAPETRNFKRGEVTYVVHIDRARPAFSFAEANVTAVLGEAVPENKLTVGLYDGEVTYASSDEAIATVDANGVVTTKAPGQVIITATGAETENCYEAQKAQYSLTVNDPSGISEIVNGQSANRKYFDLQGRRIIGSAARKGMYVVDGKKVIVK